MVFFSFFIQVDKRNGIYFYNFIAIVELLSTLALSSKTEVGSAGEQPTRDTLDGRQKYQYNGLSL